MKKIPLHKKLLLGAVTGGLGYGSYKLFKHTDAGSRKMEMISPVTPLLLVADDERRNAAIAGGVGAGVGAAGAALSSPVFGSIYGGAVHLKRAITEKNNIKSSEAQESLRRVNEIIAGLTVKQATPIFKKIIAKKKALGASTSQAQKAALKVLHRIDK